jgi:hypothetical protein
MGQPLEDRCHIFLVAADPVEGLGDELLPENRTVT